MDRWEKFFGDGKTKICVPVMGSSVGEIARKVKEIRDERIHLLEIRLDSLGDGFFDDGFQYMDRIDEMVRSSLYPVILTIRTRNEGGSFGLGRERYYDILDKIILMRQSYLVDIQGFEEGEDTIREEVLRLVGKGKENGKGIILSFHNFQETPGKEELMSRLERLQACKPNVSKVAVTPKNGDDVSLVRAIRRELDGRSSDPFAPFALISMGALGIPTRIEGGVGLALTFFKVGDESAPGQLPLEKGIGLLKGS